MKKIKNLSRETFPIILFFCCEQTKKKKLTRGWKLFYQLNIKELHVKVNLNEESKRNKKKCFYVSSSQYLVSNQMIKQADKYEEKFISR